MNKDMIYACDKDGNLVDPKVIFHGEVNPPGRTKEIMTYLFHPKQTNTLISLATTKENDMCTNITSVVSYSVVDEIIHTDGSENVRKEFDNAFTEIVKAFGNTYDQIDIAETVRMHIYATPLLEMQSIGNIYVVKQEIAHHQSFEPDTNGTLAEQNSQYEKHKAYIISPENKDMPKEINYYIAIPFLSTVKNNFNCYIMPLHPAALKHVDGYNNDYISKCTETYNKLRNWEIRCSLNKPDHKFKIGLEELDLRAAIGDNFRQWLSQTNQNSMPDTSIAIKKIPECLRFSINRFIERTKHGQSLGLCTTAKNHVAKKISAEENYITGTLQETEYQPDKQEVTINNLFKGM